MPSYTLVRALVLALRPVVPPEMLRSAVELSVESLRPKYHPIVSEHYYSEGQSRRDRRSSFRTARRAYVRARDTAARTLTRALRADRGGPSTDAQWAQVAKAAKALTELKNA